MVLGCVGGVMMSLLRDRQGWRCLVPAEENKALILRIFDLFITGETSETAGR